MAPRHQIRSTISSQFSALSSSSLVSDALSHSSIGSQHSGDQEVVMLSGPGAQPLAAMRRVLKPHLGEAPAKGWFVSDVVHQNAEGKDTMDYA